MSTAATVTYGVLRRKGYDPESVGLALAAVSVLVYGTLGRLFSGSFIYMLATLVWLGVGSEAVIPILGYRLFNF